MGRSRIKEDKWDDELLDDNSEIQEYQLLKEKNKRRRDNKIKDKDKWKNKKEREYSEDFD